MSNCSFVLSYDVGGSHATAGLIDSQSLAIRVTNFCAIDSDGSASAILDSLQTLGKGLLENAVQLGGEVLGVAVAMPGPFDYEHGISLVRHKYASLYQMNLRQELAQRLAIAGDRIVFLNDAQSFLLGENHAGAAKEVRRCVGVTLGTGVGSAFLVNGRIVESGEGVPPGGEIYCLPWDGGIVEDKISTRNIQSRFRERTGLNASVREICLAVQENPHAATVIQEFGAELGLVMKQIFTPFRPEAIVLGGAISRSAALFLPSAEKTAGDWLKGLVRVSTLLDNAPIAGAAVRCLHTLGVRSTV
jgi:glucokinase